MKYTGFLMLLMGWGIGVFAQDLPGSKATLKLEKAQLSEALKQISQQTGNATETQAGESGGTMLKRLVGLAPENAVTLEAKDRLYWSVIQELCEKRNLKVADWSQQGETKVMLIPGDGGKPPTCVSGGCMIRIAQSEVVMIRDFRSEPRRAIRMTLKVGFEPKSGVIKCAQAPNIERAMSADGQSLASNANNSEPRFDDPYNITAHQMQFELPYKPGVKSLKTFSGKIWVIQELKSEDWVIETDKAVGATRTVCDLDTLKITGLKLQGNEIMLEMDIASATRVESLMSYEQVARRIRFEELENEKNINSWANSISTRMERGKEVWVCKFSTSSPLGIKQMPSKLKIRVPTEVKALQIPFEFKDVELP